MVNLLVADDHVVLREALCQVLAGRGNFNVVGQAADGEELLTLLKNQKPDLIILDVEMPKMDGLSTLERIKEQGWGVPVLVLSADDGSHNIRNVINAGAKGFMPKNAKIEELEFAIDSILQGNTYLSPSITAQLIAGEQSPGGAPDLSVLTKREVEILKYLADGKPNREIGKMLHISSRTVDTHRSNILKKLKVRTNAELVKIALANRLITV